MKATLTFLLASVTLLAVLMLDTCRKILNDAVSNFLERVPSILLGAVLFCISRKLQDGYRSRWLYALDAIRRETSTPFLALFIRQVGFVIKRLDPVLTPALKPASNAITGSIRVCLCSVQLASVVTLMPTLTSAITSATTLESHVVQQLFPVKQGGPSLPELTPNK